MTNIVSPWIKDIQSIQKTDIYNKIKTIIKEPKESNSKLANIKSRIELLNKIKELLKNIPSNKCITNSFYNNLASINDRFFLHGRIGTKSKYGHAYLVMSKDKLIQSSIKIVDDDKYALKELKVIKKIIRHQKNNMHLPIIYKIMYCDISVNNNIWIHDKAPKSFSSFTSSTSSPSNYYIILNELAHGDLKSFINTASYANERLYINSLAQVFMSISTLHQLGYNHNDSHYGNFLFHKIPSGGCFCYKIDKKILYLENLGFIWTIWDFGLCQTLNDYYIEDYRRVINAFIPRTYRRLALNSYKTLSYHRGWNSIINEPSKLKSIIEIDNIISTNKAITSRDIFNILIPMIFTDKPIGNILNEKPINIKTINRVFP